MHEYFKYDIKNNLITLNVKLQASAKQDLIEEYYKINQKYYLKIKVKAHKIEGKANRALIDLLSKEFNVKRLDIDIITGLTNQYKSVLIKNIEYGYLKTILENYIKEKN
jgi:uncharacterized protein (TIGR00251 family)